jgi:hypothetical protein
MVAILSPGESIRNSFYYNENKVKDGVAELIHAQNYPISMDELNENTRLVMLQKLAGLNTATKVNSLHITLNFDPSERLSSPMLTEIARNYMEQIGFGNQPYLVYQHFDAGHPHIHLVTTNIEATGDRISLHHLGIRKSEPARKAIEIAYGLVKAEDRNKEHQDLRAYTAAVKYGRAESRKSIANVLNGVLPAYRYSSVAELNAVLSLYNVMADTGTENSRVFKNNGLLYHILDNSGKPVGVPIKASSFYNKPTLKFLQERFVSNSKDKLQYKTRVKNTIEFALRRPSTTGLPELISALEKEGIHTILRQNKDKVVYGITYIDHKDKCVFNGSDLGKSYSAKGILEHFGNQGTNQKTAQVSPAQLPPLEAEKLSTAHKSSRLISPSESKLETPSSALIEALMQYENDPNYLPYELSGKKKKRKKKRKSTNT